MGIYTKETMYFNFIWLPLSQTNVLINLLATFLIIFGKGEKNASILSEKGLDIILEGKKVSRLTAECWAHSSIK